MLSLEMRKLWVWFTINSPNIPFNLCPLCEVSIAYRYSLFNKFLGVLYNIMDHFYTLKYFFEIFKQCILINFPPPSQVHSHLLFPPPEPTIFMFFIFFDNPSTPLCSYNPGFKTVPRSVADTPGAIPSQKTVLLCPEATTCS